VVRLSFLAKRVERTASPSAALSERKNSRTRRNAPNAATSLNRDASTLLPARFHTTKTHSGHRQCSPPSFFKSDRTEVLAGITSRSGSLSHSASVRSVTLLAGGQVM
jgi:hypothetical protein